MLWFSKWFSSAPPPPSVVPKHMSISHSLVRKAQAKPEVIMYPIQPPVLPPGVVPAGKKAAVAMDSTAAEAYSFANLYAGAIPGFPGYPYLAALALRAEYRAFASSLSTELTREWITLTSSETAGEATKEKIALLEQELTRLGLQQVIQAIAEHDSYFGRGQIFIDIKGQNRSLPLILDKRTIKQGADISFKAVEPIWTTPTSYNAIDPAAPDFYKPSKWFMLGREVHASRLLTVITRPVPDLFKPAFNFSGVSMSQLAEPYVNNWLRTRQSVSDLISNFSIVNLATSMEQELNGGDGEDLMNRAELFRAMRDNQGVMLTDKDREELSILNVPLGGLDHLQAQAQEHMCAVSRIPAIVLTGISPSGLNATSEGEIAVFYDWIMAQLEAHYRDPIDTSIKIIQLALFGEIDKDIHFTFNPLDQQTPKELAEIRNTNAQAAGVYIDRGVISPQEDRERLARDPESGYQGLDINIEIEDPNKEEDDKDEE